MIRAGSGIVEHTWRLIEDLFWNHQTHPIVECDIINSKEAAGTIVAPDAFDDNLQTQMKTPQYQYQ